MATRVWYILMSFPLPSETFVCNDVAALVRLGAEVEVHSLRGPRGDAERLLRERGLEDLPVSHGGPRGLLPGLLAALRRPRVTARLLGWIARHSGGRPIHLAKAAALVPRAMALLDAARRERPDVVHFYWGHYPSVLAWLLLEEAPGVVVSLSLSAYDLLRGFPGSGAVARRAHLVSTWAGANVAPIAELGVPAEEVVVSYQGVDLTRVAGRRFDKEEGRIVTAGRLMEEKGMDDLLRAFARAAGEWPRARLVVLGDGPDRPRLEALAAELGVAEAVVFRGHVSHAEVFDEMARAALFVFMSRYPAERLPNVVKEAMACRCAVVSTWTPGMEELIVDGVHGHVVPQGAVDEVAERIGRLFSDRAAAGRMAAAAEARVRERFDLHRTMGGMLERWEALAG